MAPKTAVVLVDVLNDFLHPDGKLHGAVAESIKTTQMVPNLKHLVDAARKYHVPIYYACHQGWREGMHEGWQHMNSSLARIGSLHAFEEGSWGAQIYEGLEPSRSNGDVVVSKHWNSSGFANTDLNYQLRQRGISHLVMAGMTANTCLESTARYAREIGYHVTLLTNATAGFSNELTRVATDVVWPVIAEKVMTVEQWKETVSSEQGRPQL